MKLFNLLSRYVSRSFLKSFGVTALCLLAIIILFDFAELQRRAGSKDISFLIKLKMVFLRSPHFLEQVLPFLTFTSALFVFWRMNRTNELLIFRSAGVSLWRLILSMSLTAVIIGAVDLTAFNPLSCAFQARYEKLEKRYFSRSKEEIKVSATGLWLSEKMGENQAIYRASKINLKKLELEDLNIVVVSPQNKFIRRIDAKTAQIKGKRLDLKNGWETKVGDSAVPFPQKSIETSLNAKKIQEMQVNRGAFSFWKLPSYISLLENSGLQSLRFLMLWQSMLASAFWGGAMIVLAAAFSCRPLRQGKTALMILIGIIIGFFLYFFKDVVFALGVAGALPSVMAAWLPPLLTLMLGSVIVFHQEDG